MVNLAVIYCKNMKKKIVELPLLSEGLIIRFHFFIQKNNVLINIFLKL